MQKQLTGSVLKMGVVGTAQLAFGDTVIVPATVERETYHDDEIKRFLENASDYESSLI